MNESLKPRSDARLVRSLLLPVAILVVSIVAWFVVTRTETPAPPIPQPPPVEVNRTKEFYDSTLQPLVDENQRANLAAVERCLARIGDSFTKYRKGIKPFSDDITSMGTRFGILRRMPANWWYEDGRIQQYVQTKFETHIFGEKQLNDDLTLALTSLRDEIYANRSQLLASVKLAVSESDFPELAIPDYKAFDDQVNQLLVEFSSNRAKDSVYHGIATMVTSEVAVFVVNQIITRVVTAIGTSAAASAATAGGATAGGAAAGAGGGSLGGPVGTAIGLGVGLVVGILVDWWMTENFKATLESDLNKYLTDLHDGIIEGVNGEPGLRDALQDFGTDYNKAQGLTFQRLLLGGLR